jgi:hypothetical protein
MTIVCACATVLTTIAGSEFQQKRRAEIRKKIDPNTSSVSIFEAINIKGSHATERMEKK